MHLARGTGVAGQELRLLSMNCGGMRGKLPLLVALVVETDPDAVLLQEASGREQEGDLGPLGLRAFYGVPRRGGVSRYGAQSTVAQGTPRPGCLPTARPACSRVCLCWGG